MREMKKSQIPFCPEIPSTWSEMPNRYLFESHSTKVGNDFGNYQLLSLTTAGVKEKDINAGGGKVPDSYDNYQTVEPGDMVFCLFDLDCSAVFSGLSSHFGMITSAYDVFRANASYADNHFLEYWFQYVFSNRYYKMFSKNIRYTVTGDMFKSIYTPIPPIEEQRKIGAFLDERVRKIDTLIANQQAQIEKLKQYKQSLITEVVTKGLDPNVPMKDSGVEWLGKIPTNWILCRIADLYSERSESGNDSLPILTVSINTGISDHELASEDQDRVFVRSEDKSKYKRVYPGDLAYNMMRAWQGAFGAVRVDGMISPAYIVAKPRGTFEIDTRYFEALLRTPMAIEEMHRYSRGIMDFRLRLYWPEFKNIRVCLPSIEEQREIADYIDEKSKPIDALIDIKESKIDKLNQYKKSLIYEYVTGKKEVPWEA